MDTANEADVHHIHYNPVETFHYAPLNISGLRERNKIMTDFFAEQYPLLLIVDVSVEITLLARLCGIPTIVVRQHGSRHDPAHLAAYHSASALLAPYPKTMQRQEAKWLTDKTIYTGGFSRYDVKDEYKNPTENLSVAVLTGSGGTSIDLQFICYLARHCSNWNFDVIGLPKPETKDLPENIIFHGHLQDPLELLISASVVIGNAGHNTVMEMAALNKRFIAIPEDRPFDEQIQKAEILQELGLAIVIEPQAFYKTDWQSLLSDTAQTSPDWTGIVLPQATNLAAVGILSVYKSIFN